MPTTSLKMTAGSGGSLVENSGVADAIIFDRRMHRLDCLPSQIQKVQLFPSTFNPPRAPILCHAPRVPPVPTLCVMRPWARVASTNPTNQIRHATYDVLRCTVWQPGGWGLAAVFTQPGFRDFIQDREEAGSKV